MITARAMSRGLYKSLRRAHQRQVNSVRIKHPYRSLDDDDITFSERDANGIKQPHDNLLVIMLTIEGFNTRRVLVDNGSLANIMYMTTY